jgi:hypothetical protein
MTIEIRWLVFPDGERQETEQYLTINEIVDLNGFSLPLPLKNPKTIAYRMTKMRQTEERGERNVFYYLELIPVSELKTICCNFT